MKSPEKDDGSKKAKSLKRDSKLKRSESFQTDESKKANKKVCAVTTCGSVNVNNCCR